MLKKSYLYISLSPLIQTTFNIITIQHSPQTPRKLRQELPQLVRGTVIKRITVFRTFFQDILKRLITLDINLYLTAINL